MENPKTASGKVSTSEYLTPQTWLQYLTIQPNYPTGAVFPDTTSNTRLDQ